MDDAVVVSDSEKNNWFSTALFLSCIDSGSFLSFCFELESDSETAFCVLENFDLFICFCFVIIAFFFDYFFDLMYHIFCLSSVITTLYLSFLIEQFWKFIVCLFLKLSLDISVRVSDAKSKSLFFLFFLTIFMRFSYSWMIECC